MSPYDDAAARAVVQPWPSLYPFVYPLTAALAVLPLAWLPPWACSVAIVGLSSALLAWALLTHRPDAWPMLCSAPMVAAALVAQWSPLLTAVALIGGLGALAAVKPHVGVAALAYRLSPRAILAALVFLLLGCLVVPRWPIAWVSVVRSGRLGHMVPLVWSPLGWPALLLCARWRRAEARLVLALAILPITPLLYELLPVGLCARTKREAWALVGLGWVAFVYIQWAAPFATFGALVTRSADAIRVLLLWPAVAIVLRRPNEGAALAWSAWGESTRRAA